MTIPNALSSTPVLNALDDVPAGKRVLTIGTFDGVHRGHQGLLQQAVEQARALGLPAMAVTFEPIPAMVLRPEHFDGRLCSAAEKLQRLRDTGVDEVLVLAFNRDFSQLTAETFMGDLVDTTTPVEILTGEAFALGKNRSGNVDTLTKLGERLGYRFHAMPRFKDGGEIISSSAIRNALLLGDARKAERFLGRPFRVVGPVIHGAHFGRTIGYPTANVTPATDLVPLADGIYVSRAILPGRTAPVGAMTYVGTRPTVNTGHRLIETHILDFDGDLYGYELSVDVLLRLRPDETFATIDKMIVQLGKDEAATRAALSQIS